jgi:hypothetical protein
MSHISASHYESISDVNYHLICSNANKENNASAGKNFPRLKHKTFERGEFQKFPRISLGFICAVCLHSLHAINIFILNMKSVLKVCNLGRKDYSSTLALQQKISTVMQQRRKQNPNNDNILLFVEHEPNVITMGKRMSENDFITDIQTLKLQYNTEVIKTNRGGLGLCIV